MAIRRDSNASGVSSGRAVRLIPGKDKLPLVPLYAGRRLSAGRRGAGVEGAGQRRGESHHAECWAADGRAADGLSPQTLNVPSTLLRAPSARE